MRVSAISLAVILSNASTAAFNVPACSSTSLFRTVPGTLVKESTSLFPQPRTRKTVTSATTLSPSDGGSSDEKQGIFTFKTKYGYLNPFAIWYGVIAILLGLPWFVALTFCQLIYKVSSKLDTFKRLPTFFTQIWGTWLLRLTNSFPKIEGRDILKNFYKENRAAMIVANHNSWMDIPFVGSTIGWRNYKLISKAELAKVPILGKSIEVGGHVMVDRTDRRSQIMTLKAGMQWLKDGVHLCTFPEGTRSKTGKLLPFKNGAFKMAHKVGAPIIPLSIVGSGKVHPANWMFPRKHSSKECKVVIHEPIESSDKTEAELAALVRKAIISGLPMDQRPDDE